MGNQGGVGGGGVGGLRQNDARLGRGLVCGNSEEQHKITVIELHRLAEVFKQKHTTKWPQGELFRSPSHMDAEARRLSARSG